jgi:hypothetical protein
MLKERITRQILQDGSRPWGSLKMLRGSITNGQNPLFHLGISLWVRGLASEWLAKQHPRVSGRSLTQALFPLLNPTQGSTEALGELLSAPFRMLLQQALEHGSVCQPMFLLHHLLLSRKDVS